MLLITGQENLRSNLGHITFRNRALLSKIKESDVVECFVFGKGKGRSNAFGIYCVSVLAALFLLGSVTPQRATVFITVSATVMYKNEAAKVKFSVSKGNLRRVKNQTTQQMNKQKQTNKQNPP